MKISVIIITENEEKNINDCISSAIWADEILVVDSGSKDRTIELASKAGAKVVQTNEQNVTQKRKFSIPLCSNEWIFFLDADERFTPELAEEIGNLPLNHDIAAFYVNRLNYYLGKQIKYCAMSPDYHIRLFDRRKSSVIDRIIHEAVKTDGKTEKLVNSFLHFTVPDLETMVKKINYYSTMEAQEHFDNGKVVSKLMVLLKALSAFLRTYISRKGYKEGIQGFYVSVAESFTNFLTHLKLLKLQNKL